MKKKISSSAILLSATLLIAAFFRLFQLGSLPISLFGDEVDVAYQAWSLITTGRDYMGNLLPSYIQSLSEWRAPLLMYITAPFVFFSRSPFMVRLPVALLGVSSVFWIYILTKKLFNSEKHGLFSALMLAMTPWHLHYSRASFEVVPLLFLEILGTYLFISGKVFLSLIPFILTLYTYSTANIFTPLLILSLLLIYKPKVWSLKNLPKVIFPVLVFLPIAYNILLGPASGRFKLVSIFNDPKTFESIILQRTDPWVNVAPVETLFHNKYLSFAASFGANYVRSFSLEFLFLTGDPNPRQSIQGLGELLWIVLPFFLYGLFLTLKNLNEKSSQLTLSWLLIAPIASSLTQGGGNHATRLFTMLPPLIFISSTGLTHLLSSLRGATATWQSHSIKIILFTLLILSFSTYWHRYSDHYRFESARYWHNGYSQIFSELKPYLGGSNKIYINNTAEPSLIRFALFTDLHPAEFIKNFKGDNPNNVSTASFQGFMFNERYYFGQARDGEFMNLLEKGDIYLAAQGREIPGFWDWAKETPSGLKVLGSVTDIFGYPQFIIVESTK